MRVWSREGGHACEHLKKWYRELGKAAFHWESHTFPHLLQLLLFYCNDVSSQSGSISPQSVISALSPLLEPSIGTTEVDTGNPTDSAGWAVVCERGEMRDLPHYLL